MTTEIKINRPLRIDVYAKTHNMTQDQVLDQIKKNGLAGELWKDVWYVESLSHADEIRNKLDKIKKVKPLNSAIHWSLILGGAGFLSLYFTRDEELIIAIVTAIMYGVFLFVIVFAFQSARLLRAKKKLIELNGGQS